MCQYANVQICQWGLWLDECRAGLATARITVMYHWNGASPAPTFD